MFRIKSRPVDLFSTDPPVRMNVLWVPWHNFQEQSTEGIWRHPRHREMNEANTTVWSHIVPKVLWGFWYKWYRARQQCKVQISLFLSLIPYHHSETKWVGMLMQIQFRRPDISSSVLFDALKQTLPARILTELWYSATPLSGMKHNHGMKGSVPLQLWCWGIPRTSQCTAHSVTCCKTTRHQCTIFCERTTPAFICMLQTIKKTIKHTITTITVDPLMYGLTVGVGGPIMLLSGTSELCANIA